jgi:hypothetical protein
MISFIIGFLFLGLPHGCVLAMVHGSPRPALCSMPCSRTDSERTKRLLKKPSSKKGALEELIEA